MNVLKEMSRHPVANIRENVTEFCYRSVRKMKRYSKILSELKFKLRLCLYSISKGTCFTIALVSDGFMKVT